MAETWESEIAAIKSKLLTIESEMQGLTGKAAAAAKEEMAGLRAELKELLKKAPDPVKTDGETKKEPEDERDEVGRFIDGPES